MSILDPIVSGQPGGIGGGVGGSVLSNIPGTIGTIAATTTPYPRIIYNGKAIDLPTWPRRWQVDPHPLTTFDLNEDASSVVTSYERLDIFIQGEFPPMANGTIHDSLLNWFQNWASKGYGWYFTLDGSKVVNTIITATTSSTTLTLSDTTGVTANSFYKLMNGFDYALVRVNSVSGNNITLNDQLDTTFPLGSIFRDQRFYRCVIRDNNASNPVVDMTGLDDSINNYFRFNPTFYEDAIL